MEKEINSDLTFESQVKMKNKRIIAFVFLRIAIVLVFAVSFLVYLLTPISSLEHLNLVGNIYLNNNDIYQILNCSNPSNTSLYSIDVEKSKELIGGYEIIDTVEVDINPFSMTVSLKENPPCLKYNGHYYYLNGEEISSDVLNDSNLSDYFERSLKNVASLIKNQDLKEVKYKNEYLLMLCNVNKDKCLVEYVEFNTETDGDLYLYYKSSDNDVYFRVRLMYSDGYKIDDYINYLTSEKLLSYLNENAGEEKVHDDSGICYRDVNLDRDI